VRALLRRDRAIDSPQHGQSFRDTIQGEDLELDCSNQLAHRQGRLIELSEKETQLLEYLMRHPGQLLTHDQIHQYLWSDSHKPSSNVLAALVRLLRRKVEAIGETPLIHTVYGKGYRFGSNPE
jgi:OmpR-family two-component system manganese-sensing response regulator